MLSRAPPRDHQGRCYRWGSMGNPWQNAGRLHKARSRPRRSHAHAGHGAGGSRGGGGQRERLGLAQGKRGLAGAANVGETGQQAAGIHRSVLEQMKNQWA